MKNELQARLKRQSGTTSKTCKWMKMEPGYPECGKPAVAHLKEQGLSYCQEHKARVESVLPSLKWS